MAMTLIPSKNSHEIIVMKQYSQHVKISGFWGLISTKTMNIADSLENLKDKLRLRTIKLEAKLFFQRISIFFQPLLPLQTE